jgi:glyoxylase-like metal-dependent hydrolase (beta-lactamase superfamily II)
MSADVHEIFAIRYGHHDRKAAENYIGGDPHDILQPLDYYVWAIVGAHGTFIVDTGFDEAMARKRKRLVEKPIGEGLKAIGIDPDKVENVIVTHLHYDHTGNYQLFPRARYHLQDVEMAYATGRCMCHAPLRFPFELDDVVAMVSKVFAGRVEFHDGADQIAPGITVHRVGGHSKGLQCVRVKTKRGDVVIASDATHLYAHIETGRIFPVTYNVGDVLEGYATIKKLAPSMHHIVPGHDPQVLDRYPAAKPGLEGWVVRLDVEPKITKSP